MPRPALQQRAGRGRAVDHHRAGGQKAERRGQQDVVLERELTDRGAHGGGPPTGPAVAPSRGACFLGHLLLVRRLAGMLSAARKAFYDPAMPSGVRRGRFTAELDGDLVVSSAPACGSTVG